MYKGEVFEAEDLLVKQRNVVQRRGRKGWWNSKIPIRFWIGCMVFLTTYINYTTRVNMSISIVSMTGAKNKSVPECKREENAGGDNPKPPPPLPDYGPRYDWNEHIQGMVLGSYFWGYVITSLPGGFIAEWLGPLHTVFWTQLVTAIFNVGSVYAAPMHYGYLVATRFVIGFCAGPIYPALQCLIARWAPPAEKGKFVAALMGNTLGTCLTWPLVGAITELWGWAWGFHIVTIQIGVFCVIYWFVCSDTPSEHRWISDEEKDYIAQAQGGTVTKKKTIPPYGKIFLSIPFWALTVCHWGNLWGLYLQLTGVPKFLVEVIGFDLKKSGGLAALPHLLRLFLGLGFGALADSLMHKELVSKTFLRKGFILCSHIIPGILLIGISFVGCNWVPIVVLLIFSMSINGAAVMTNLQNPQDLAPNYAGTMFGIISFIGGMTGFITPSITGALTAKNKGVKEWGWNFIIGGGMYIGCGLFFIIFGSVETQPWNEKKE